MVCLNESCNLLVFSWTDADFVVVVEKALHETVVGCAVADMAEEKSALHGTIVWIFEHRIEYSLQVFGMIGRYNAVERQADHHGRIVERYVVGYVRIRTLAQR